MPRCRPLYRSPSEPAGNRMNPPGSRPSQASCRGRGRRISAGYAELPAARADRRVITRSILDRLITALAAPGLTAARRATRPRRRPRRETTPAGAACSPWIRRLHPRRGPRQGARPSRRPPRRGPPPAPGHPRPSAHPALLPVGQPRAPGARPRRPPVDTLRVEHRARDLNHFGQWLQRASKRRSLALAAPPSRCSDHGQRREALGEKP